MVIRCIICERELEVDESCKIKIGPICLQHFEQMKHDNPQLTINEFIKKKKQEEYNNKNKRECSICSLSGMETSLWKRGKEWRCMDHKDIEKYPLKIKNKKKEG